MTDYQKKWDQCEIMATSSNSTQILVFWMSANNTIMIVGICSFNIPNHSSKKKKQNCVSIQIIVK